MVRLFGILNVTRDSFSDGGRWLVPEQAIARGLQLLADGADVIDVGAESTHPDAEDVSAAEEIARLSPVVAALVAAGAQVSIDTAKPAVIEAMAALGARWWNDVSGLRAPGALAVAARTGLELVVMYSRAPGPRALRDAAAPADVLAAIESFWRERREALAAAGVDRRRIVLDPGMGFFLAADPAPSLLVLKRLALLRQRAGCPLLVSVSRKSFLGSVTGQPVAGRAAATLAAELWAVAQGIDCVRTHDVRALRDALRVRAAIDGADDAGPATAYKDPPR